MTRKSLKDDRLRAASQAGGFVSLEQLAKKAGVARPTLSRILNGQTRAVNAATLEQLAGALRVPAEWLTGEQENLPYVPEWGPGSTRKGKGPSLWERPTADHVRYSWLMQQVEAALRRDLGDWYGEEAGDAYNSWGHVLLAVFAELSSSVVWRIASLGPCRAGSGSNPLEQSDDSPTIDWVTHILEPWLAGRAYLNAGVLRGVFEALLANPERLWGSEIRDADALRALERYAAGCSKAEDERLEAEFIADDAAGFEGT
jgi:transcriptional regulator with XRE-family HTH domain